MYAVVEIDIGRAGFVALDETACAGPRKSMRGFVVHCRIRFRLDDDPGAFAPNQFGADELARALERIAFKKSRADNLLTGLLNSVGPIHYTISEDPPLWLEQAERAEVRGGGGCLRDLHSTYPHRSLLPPEGEATHNHP